MSNQTIQIRVIPRSSKNGIVGRMADGTLKIKLKAPPVDGKANEELIEILSKEFGLSKSRLRIVKGMRGRNKAVEVD